MVAYSFKSRFAEPILAGTKGGTIRANRRRHARPGETLHLYTGMRTKQCRLIAQRTCLAVQEIMLLFEAPSVIFLDEGGTGHIPPKSFLDDFARFDGFASWTEMADFWRAVHDEDGLYFRGWHIRWQKLPLEFGP